MSQYKEVIQVVKSIASDSERRSYVLAQYAEEIGRFRANFSAAVNGTNDSSAREVCAAFLATQKELCKAAKASVEAAQAGYDWCGDTQKKHVLKKVK